jgi:hypothetical protein
MEKTKMAVLQERREVSGFDEIHLEGSGDILLVQGETEELVIEADEALLPKLKSEVNNGRLVLGLRHWYDTLLAVATPRVHYRITVRSLRGASISGSGSLSAGRLQTDRLRLKVSGSAGFDLADLQATDLELDFSGSGKANLKGTAQRQEIDISGSGEVHADELDSQEARVHISGSGRVRLRVQERLDVRISGSGEVRYHGQPKVEQRISGSGSIQAVR